jgi:hypothetical protein
MGAAAGLTLTCSISEADLALWRYVRQQGRTLPSLDTTAQHCVVVTSKWISFHFSP